MIGLGLSRNLAVALAFLAAGGAANFILSTFRNAITQTRATDQMRGRTQGALIVITLGGPSLATVAHGTVGAAVGTAWAISGGGALTVLAMLATVAAVPSFWSYRDSRS